MRILYRVASIGFAIVGLIGLALIVFLIRIAIHRPDQNPRTNQPGQHLQYWEGYEQHGSIDWWR